MTNEIIQKTEAMLKEKFLGEGTGHDWWHIDRVRNNALTIAQQENADMFIVELAALLHDIADWKFSESYNEGPQQARTWMEQCNVDEETIKHVCNIIEHISFKGAQVENKISTKEGMVVQDADRLDAIGAVGIARCFAYGGHAGHEMHNPDIKPVMHDSFEKYKTTKGTSINHFHEKLLLLKDMMNTTTGKQMAEQRHAFMEGYLKQFFKEWEGH